MIGKKTHEKRLNFGAGLFLEEEDPIEEDKHDEEAIQIESR